MAEAFGSPSRIGISQLEILSSRAAFVAWGAP
jgi:hypothetical protein